MGREERGRRLRGHAAACRAGGHGHHHVPRPQRCCPRWVPAPVVAATAPRQSQAMLSPTRDEPAGPNPPSPPWGHLGTASPCVPCVCKLPGSDTGRGMPPCHPTPCPHGTGVGCAPRWLPPRRAAAGQDAAPAACRGRGAAGACSAPGGVSDVPYWSHYISFSLALSADMRDRRGFSGRSHRAAPLADGWRGWGGGCRGCCSAGGGGR